MPAFAASGLPQTFAGIAGAVALIVATPFVVSADTHDTLGAPGVAVPDVVGMPEADATATLAEAGLASEPERNFNDDVETGLVFASAPFAGAWIDAGGTVRLDVSDGPRMVAVADFSALTLADAPNAIDPRGGPSLVVVGEYSDDVAEGMLISQDVAAGESVRHDTVVNVVYSLGFEPVVIPKVTGKKKAKAIEVLEDAGLKVKTKTQSSDSVDKGDVIKQSPKAGEEGHRTDTVTIWVSSGIDLVAFRKLATEIYAGFFGLTKAQATAYAKKHGVSVVFTDVEAYHPAVKVGKVSIIGCSPNPPLFCYLYVGKAP